MSSALSDAAKAVLSACKKGQFNQVQELLEQGLELTDINHRSFSPLNVALKNGRWKIAKYLLEQQILPEQSTCPPLIAAAQHNKDQTQGLELVFSHTADLAVTDQNGRTALMTACLLGHPKKVKYLLQQDDMLDAEDHVGMNAFLDAIISQSHQILEQLIERGTNINHQNQQGDNALLIAMQQPTPNVRIIKTLLTHGVDPSSTNHQGKSALSIAEKKHPTILKLYVKKIEADKQIELPLFGHLPDPENQHSTETDHKTTHSSHTKKVEPVELTHKKQTPDANSSAWFEAINKGNLGQISQLLNKGIPVDLADFRGCSGLIHAAGKGHRAVASYLIQNQANIEHRSDNGSTPLSSAIISNSRNLVGLLLKHGANANGQGPGGYPYLSLAASQWSEACLSMLLDAGGDLNTTDDLGMPLYHHVAMAAEYYGNTAKAKHTLRLIHQHGLDINVKNMQGNTALHIICGANKTKQYNADDAHVASIAHEMLKLEINPKIVNNDGFTAIQYAKKHGLLNTNGVILSYMDAW